MSCFPCFQSQKSKKLSSESKKLPPTAEVNAPGGSGHDQNVTQTHDSGNIQAQSFTFRELASATKNFRQECLLGEGGFGRVYRGMLHPSGQVVAVKQLDRNGLQENKEFMAEVSTISLLHHENLVNLVGYCTDGDQRLLVYEYMPGGSLDDHLLDLKAGKKALDWKTRMKIGCGAAQGLEYLHEKANPAVVYHNLKPSNILLDEEFNPKLSDFGLANLNALGDKNHVSLMGTYGYSAPEDGRNGNFSTKSDIYSFGVILLELITGRRAVDTTRPIDEQNLVAWAQPILRDPKRFPDMADPNLNKQFPEKSLNQAVAIAAMCVQEEPTARPLMSDVMTALSFLTAVEDAPAPITPLVMSEELNKGKDSDSDSSSDDDYADGMSEEEEGEDEDENVKSKKRGSKKSKSSKQRISDDDGSDSSSGRGSRASDSLKKKSKKYFSLGRKSSKTSVFSLSKKSRGGEEDEEEEEKEWCLSRNSSKSSHNSNLSRNSSTAMSRNMSRASQK